MVDRLPLSAWKVDSLRMTVFPPALLSIGSQNWWSEITGDTPEISTVEQKKSIHRISGPYEGGSLGLGISPFRIDWVWGAIADPERIDELPIVGQFPEACAKFKGLMLKWFELPSLPNIKRLAVGISAFLPVQDHKTAYQLLGAYLPYMNVDPVNSSDLIYQINRPRESKSGVADLRINRLSKWGAIQVSVEMMGPQPIRGAEKFACKLDMDFNTFPAFPREIGKADAPKVFDELLDLAQEVAVKGDIP